MPFRSSRRQNIITDRPFHWQNWHWPSIKKEKKRKEKDRSCYIYFGAWLLFWRCLAVSFFLSGMCPPIRNYFIFFRGLTFRKVFHFCVAHLFRQSGGEEENKPTKKVGQNAENRNVCVLFCLAAGWPNKKKTNEKRKTTTARKNYIHKSLYIILPTKYMSFCLFVRSFFFVLKWYFAGHQPRLGTFVVSSTQHSYGERRQRLLLRRPPSTIRHLIK